MTRIVVVGTGTEIGKTHASIAITSALATMGVSVVALKPIESGVPADPKDASSDAGSLAAFSSHPVSAPPYAFADAVSPHLAARRAGVTIDLGRIAAWVNSHTARMTLVETAGALLSPIGKGLTNLDLVRAIQPDRVLLVASDRLGVLHDVAATLHAYRTLAKLPEPTLLLQQPSTPDTSTNSNAAELEWLGLVPRVFVFPRAKPTDPAVQDVARAILADWGITAR